MCTSRTGGDFTNMGRMLDNTAIWFIYVKSTAPILSSHVFKFLTMFQKANTRQSILVLATWIKQFEKHGTLKFANPLAMNPPNVPMSKIKVGHFLEFSLCTTHVRLFVRLTNATLSGMAFWRFFVGCFPSISPHSAVIRNRA